MLASLSAAERSGLSDRFPDPFNENPHFGREMALCGYITGNAYCSTSSQEAPDRSVSSPGSVNDIVATLRFKAVDCLCSSNYSMPQADPCHEVHFRGATLAYLGTI